MADSLFYSMSVIKPKKGIFMRLSKVLAISGVALLSFKSLNAAGLARSEETILAAEFGIGFQKVESRDASEGTTKYKSSTGDIIVWVYHEDKVPYTEDPLTMVKIRCDVFTGGRRVYHLMVTDSASASSALYLYMYNPETEKASLGPKDPSSSSDSHIALIKKWGRKKLLPEWHID